MFWRLTICPMTSHCRNTKVVHGTIFIKGRPLHVGLLLRRRNGLRGKRRRNLRGEWRGRGRVMMMMLKTRHWGGVQGLWVESSSSLYCAILCTSTMFCYVAIVHFVKCTWTPLYLVIMLCTWTMLFSNCQMQLNSGNFVGAWAVVKCLLVAAVKWFWYACW